MEDVKVNLKPRNKVEILRKFYEFNLRQNALPLIGLPNRKENIFRQNFYIFIAAFPQKGIGQNVFSWLYYNFLELYLDFKVGSKVTEYFLRGKCSAF